MTPPVTNLIVVQLSEPVERGDSRRLAEQIVEQFDNVESATPAYGDGFGRTVYVLEEMVR